MAHTHNNLNNSPQYLHAESQSGYLESPGSSVFDLPRERAESGVERLAVVAPPPATNLSNPKSFVPGKPSFIVVSGGTGGNAICSEFVDACFVLPVSDDGGSSSEIIRVLGGPSVGDIRSRLVRLIPRPESQSSPLEAIKNLLAYRLPAKYSYKEAREEWRDIVEGRSFLWKGIPNDRKETIRGKIQVANRKPHVLVTLETNAGFLVYFESELLKRAHKNFDFRNGSIGNYLIAAAQNFFRSLPSAIFLFSSITNSQAHILPVIITNHTVTIAAELENGEHLVGQCEISHPVASSDAVKITTSEDLAFAMNDLEEIPVSSHNVMYQPASSQGVDTLSARISKIYYINSYGMEIHPSPNPEFISNLNSKDILVYSCGSLWTSIMPCLALRGVATAIASSYSLRAKVFLLNAENDRETHGYSAIDYINAIVRTLNTSYSTRQYGLGNANTTYPASAFMTDLVYLSGTEVSVDRAAVGKLGIRCTEIPSMNRGEKASRFDGKAVRMVLERIWAERQEEYIPGHRP